MNLFLLAGISNKIDIANENFAKSTRAVIRFPFLNNLFKSCEKFNSLYF